MTSFNFTVERIVRVGSSNDFRGAFVIMSLHFRRFKSADHTFHQTLYYARDKWGEIVNNLVLLQYQFDGPEHSIKALPHGNSKSGKSFTRTKPSVKRVLSEHLKGLQASEAVAKTRKDLGAPLRLLL